MKAEFVEMLTIIVWHSSYISERYQQASYQMRLEFHGGRFLITGFFWPFLKIRIFSTRKANPFVFFQNNCLKLPILL